MMPADKEQEGSSPEATEAIHSGAAPSSDSGATNAFLRGLQWVGLRLLFGAEFVGEIVANVLGLNESKFQYVIDGMSEEDWEVAREVQAQREREEQEARDGKDVEGSAGVEELSLEDRMKRTQASMLMMREG